MSIASFVTNPYRMVSIQENIIISAHMYIYIGTLEVMDLCLVQTLRRLYATKRLFTGCPCKSADEIIMTQLYRYLL
jgi:hypothetical protein